MGTPSDHLPSEIPQDAINELLVSRRLPTALTISQARVTAAFHSVYFITLPPNDATRHNELVLRVSGTHLPRIKTENEVAVMSWLSTATKLPLPDVVAYDSSESNPIGHEYTLLSRAKGVTLSDAYKSLDHNGTIRIIDQLIDILVQLHEHVWDGIGGLNRNADGDIVLARIVDETFWFLPEIGLWPAGETVSSLNIGGPYSTYVELVVAQTRHYSRLIEINESLEPVRDILLSLQRFVDLLLLHAEELNNVKLRLAHKDLHFANILFDETSGKITAILDWEFSGVVPFPLWDPRKAFLWNGSDEPDSKQEKHRLTRLFEKRCAERGVDILRDVKLSPLQQKMQDAADFLRAIVEVSPRGQRQELIPGWKARVVESIAAFGV